MAGRSRSTASDWVDYAAREVLDITLMRAHFKTHRFERHSHERFSIALTTSGVQSFHCGGALRVSLPGDLILFNPDQAHDGHQGAPEGFGYTMLYVPIETMTGNSDPDAHLLLGRHFSTPVARDPDLARQFVAAVAAIEQPGETLRGQELVTAFFSALMRRHGERARSDLAVASTGARRMSLARDYLAANFHRDVAIAELAAMTQLSRAHFSRAFTRHYGVPPHVWLNAVRLSQARRMLLHGEPAAEVAVACGFADQSHFSRRFKGAMGVSPARWLQQMRRD
ncbi:AraC family transcriptional regulator [Roseateles amylovorans]|uniref:AraC family transcriptional regulator n=1 Tax=Roseateles amylovorans TaxID=2978473 RepID=A0ABY6B1X2_9BURK|nr:AraC family transcriptional regulator [Roseateles amylovorans]UXH78553.1 AraC family transcriptional regulator [Roseateles amylovorans]